MKVVKAVLCKDIEYKKNGYVIEVMEGVDILVDTETSIALIGNDHVDIGQDEYQLIN